MYYVLVTDDMVLEEHPNRQVAVDLANEVMDSGNYREIHVVLVTDKFTRSVRHVEVV